MKTVECADLILTPISAEIHPIRLKFSQLLVFSYTYFEKFSQFEEISANLGGYSANIGAIFLRNFLNEGFENAFNFYF
jgi:hypothetical protein